MQLVVISGKGGTGKTTIAASISYLSKNKINVDCDVDASNLHILLGGKDIVRQSYTGAKMAKINSSQCIQCGACTKVCRFDAIKDFTIDEFMCEGCGTCTIACEFNAITLQDEITGEKIISETKYGILSHADMIAGAEGSGKLVTEVRKNARNYKTDNNELLILDGSPGIGCSVMASVTGCDMALIVVEPSQSGLEDFKRVLSIVKHFRTKPYVCINKWDIHQELTKAIEKVCLDKNINIIGKVPYDPTVEIAINELQPVVCYTNSTAGKAIRELWKNLNNEMKKEET